MAGTAASLGFTLDSWLQLSSDEEPAEMHKFEGDSAGSVRRTSSPEWHALLARLSRTVGLRGPALEAMRLVDRADFVPGGGSAYVDSPQRIGHSATISAPHMHATALMLLSEQLLPGCKALDVGCGSGYLSAAMAHMVKPTGTVLGIDYIEPLVDLAHKNISKSHGELLRSGCLRLEMGDGWKGCSAEAPFDAIHVGAAADCVPEALVEQLRPGGRLLVPVGSAGGEQVFTQVDKDYDGGIVVRRLGSVVYVPLVRAPSC